MHLDGAPGDVNLLLDTKRMYIVSNSLGSVTLSGQTDILSVGYYYNDAWFYGEYLKADSVFIDHTGYNKIRVRPSISLKGQIVLNGCIEYYTENATVEVDIQANGKLVHAGS